jgi:hypothetical protein
LLVFNTIKTPVSVCRRLKSLTSRFHLEPQLDQSADRIGAAGLVVLGGGPCIYLGKE